MSDEGTRFDCLLLSEQNANLPVRRRLVIDRLERTQNPADVIDVVTLSIQLRHLAIESQKLPGLAGGNTTENWRLGPPGAFVKEAGARHLRDALP